MDKKRGQLIAIESLVELDDRLALGVRNLSGWRLHDLDLRERSLQLSGVRVAGALFLGCTMSAAAESDLRARGATVFPELPDVPVNSYRTELYTAEELYGAGPYADSLDATVYAWTAQAATRDVRMAQALHDHAIDEALAEWAAGRHLVGVMGGHALQRGELAYAEAVRLGNGLAEHATVATGGGPGAMEAANLGAWLADPAYVEPAVEQVARRPSFRPDIGAWAATAFAVRRQWPDARESLGIPTWHYGHEPPNAFATAIAKYFRNATREDILLQLCDRGIVFLPGAGGTVQEIFQDACENYYADESSVAPMILVGRRHWAQDVPAWDLLRALSRGRPMESHVHLVDTVDEAVALIARAAGA